MKTRIYDKTGKHFSDIMMIDEIIVHCEHIEFIRRGEKDLSEVVAKLPLSGLSFQVIEDE